MKNARENRMRRRRNSILSGWGRRRMSGQSGESGTNNNRDAQQFIICLTAFLLIN